MIIANDQAPSYVRLVQPYIQLTNNIKKDLAAKLSFMYRAKGNMALIGNRSKLEAIVTYHYNSLNEISEYAEIMYNAGQHLDDYGRGDISSLQKNVVEIIALNRKILEIAQSYLPFFKAIK